VLRKWRKASQRLRTRPFGQSAELVDWHRPLK
jgi:hypothetical protein